MFVPTSCFYQLWILFCCVHIIKAAILLKKNETTTNTAYIDYDDVSPADFKNDTSGPVTFDLKDWLVKVKPTEKKYLNLTIIPILAIVAFIWILSLRVCKWIRDDSKIAERGCSYDVTSYVIITQEDEDFQDIKPCDSPYLYYPAMPRNLQNLIDNKMYDTVTSYTSILRQNYLRNGRRSPTPDKLAPEQIPITNQIQKKGRFYVTPVIENYVRLKNETEGRILEKRMGSLTEPSSLESSWNKPQRKILEPSESFCRLKSKLQKINHNKRNVCLQVKKSMRNVSVQVDDDLKTQKRKIVKDFIIKSDRGVNSEYKVMHKSSTEPDLQCKSLKQLDMDQYNSNGNSLSNSFDYSSEANTNKIFTNAIVHSDAETSDTIDTKCYSLELMDELPLEDKSLKSHKLNSKIILNGCPNNENVPCCRCYCSLHANKHSCDKSSVTDNDVDLKTCKDKILKCKNECLSTSNSIHNDHDDETDKNGSLSEKLQLNCKEPCPSSCNSNTDKISSRSELSDHSVVFDNQDNSKVIGLDGSSVPISANKTCEEDRSKCFQECLSCNGCGENKTPFEHSYQNENNCNEKITFYNLTKRCSCN